MKKCDSPETNTRNFAKIRHELPQKKVEFRKKNITFDFCISQVGVLSSRRTVTRWISKGLAGEHRRLCSGMSTPAGPRTPSISPGDSLRDRRGWLILYVDGHRCATTMSARPQRVQPQRSQLGSGACRRIPLVRCQMKEEGQKGRRSGPSGVVHLREVDVLQQASGISNPSPCLRRLHRLRGRG